MRQTSIRLLLIVTLVLLAVSPAGGQNSSQDPYGPNVTRERLQALLAEYEEAAASSAYSSRFRAQAKREAELIRARLEMGDFQVGDRIVLRVEGEAAFNETFTVSAGPEVVLPMVGPIPLHGVLRSELEEHLREQIGRYIRNPVVYARALIRVSILGAVGRPGFYSVSPESLVTDVLMEAGGPRDNANLTSIRIERGNERLWSGEELEQAIIEGRTLDQLYVRAGDRIVVPESRRIGWIALIGALGTITFTLSRLTNLF